MKNYTISAQYAVNPLILDREEGAIVLEEAVTECDGLKVVLMDIKYYPEEEFSGHVVIGSCWTGNLFEIEIKPSDEQLEDFVKVVEEEIYRNHQEEMRFLLYEAQYIM